MYLYINLPIIVYVKRICSSIMFLHLIVNFYPDSDDIKIVTLMSLEIHL